MTGITEWRLGLQSLELPPGAPVIAHASLSAFGQVEGGAQTVVGALLSHFKTLVMPAFTYATLVTPEVGPAYNGLAYGARQYSNSQAVFFDPDMPVDRLMGAVAETLRRQPGASRSVHPILSFVGVNAAAILASQTLAEPLAPIGRLAEQDGWVLLMGVDHSVNTSVHYAERLAERPQFIRWALTKAGVVECPRFPGCSDGFNVLAAPLAEATRRAIIGRGLVQAIPLAEVIRVARSRLAQDPLALLCDRTYCDRCQDFRERQPAASGSPLSRVIWPETASPARREVSSSDR